MVHWSFLLEGVGTLDIESLFSGLAYVASFLPEFLVAVDDLTFAKQSMYCMFVSVTVASQLWEVKTEFSLIQKKVPWYMKPKQAEAMPNKLYAAWVTDKDACLPPSTSAMQVAMPSQAVACVRVTLIHAQLFPNSSSSL